GSYSSDESFSSSFSSASRRSLYLFESIGYMPQNTIGFIFLYPWSGVSAGLSASVIVSPTRESPTVLIAAVRKPTSPTVNSFTPIGFGVLMPTSATSNSLPVAIILILSPGLTVPSMILIEEMTPLYGSNMESKISAFNGAEGSPAGGGTVSTMLSRISCMPMLAFADALIASSLGSPTTSSTS